MRDQPGAAPQPPPGMESSFELLRAAQSGDEWAMSRLCERYLPPLRRWASHRLPAWARDLMDTDDLVQETVIGTLGHVKDFEPRRDGALQAYLRMALQNRIRNEIRRVRRHPTPGELSPDRAQGGPSPLEQAIGQQALDRYEAALRRLRDADREAIVARIEMDLSYAQVAEALGKPSPDAARVAVSRALMRLAREMSREDSG